MLVQQEQLFMFINVSAIHQPNYFYEPVRKPITLQSHGTALQYVDGQLPCCFEAFRQQTAIHFLYHLWRSRYSLMEKIIITVTGRSCYGMGSTHSYIELKATNG